MTDETIAADDGGLVADDEPEATEAQEASDTDEAPETEESADAEESDEDGGDEEDEGEPEEIEFSFRGEKLRVPKGAIPEELATKVDQFVRDAEAVTTRKLQDVAERSKSLEAREAAAEKIVGLQGEALNTFTKGLQLRNEIEQLTAMVADGSLWQSNPDQARQASDQLSRKRAEFDNVINEVSKYEGELSAAQQSEIDRRMNQGRQTIEKRVKGFSEKAPEVVDYVVSQYGLTKEHAETWPLNPETAEMAYKAMMYDRMQAKAKQATAKPKPVAPTKPVTPGNKGAGGKPVRDVSKMSTTDMAKHLGLPG
jgi:hypothetical protein